MSFLVATIQADLGAAPLPVPAPQEQFAPATAPDLESLVAPIALYSDALVAQILGASTFPNEVVDADKWLKSNSNLSGENLKKAVDKQAWDPSVKALTQFPSVLDNMSKNLAWTSALGEASGTQQQDVMMAIQSMRAKAYAAGNLKSGKEIKVVQESPQVIVIQQANPQVVYVPQYNPTVVYGTPVTTPGYSSSDVAAAAVISFGLGVAIGALASNSCSGWSYSTWNMNWHRSVVVHNCGSYYGNPYWRGGYYPGYHPGYYPPYPPHRPPYPPAVRPPYPPGGRPPYPPPGTRPPYPSQPIARPMPSPATKPATLPATPTTRPSVNPGTPTTMPSSRELRGYPQQTPAATPTKPDAFSGSAGGRAQSVRGNSSLSGSSARAGGRR
jgi:Protein of unknown function (DUF3300)